MGEVGTLFLKTNFSSKDIHSYLTFLPYYLISTAPQPPKGGVRSGFRDESEKHKILNTKGIPLIEHSRNW
jgi:hypothetical protein